jgi:hypothetical protein
MNIDLATCNHKLRERIQKQISQEDAAKNAATAKNDCNQRVAELVRAQPKPNQRRASQNPGVDCRAALVGYGIFIISYRTRLLDSHDNLRTAHKALVDRITESLGFRSDNDPRLQWSYEQVKSASATGTHVLITRL